jgi:glycosyltransferase involved in cell wall biosynthesis
MLVVSVSPLSKPFVNRIEHMFQGSSIMYLTLSELRRLKFIEILKKIRQKNQNIIYLAFEDEGSKKLKGLLLLITFFSNAKKIKSFDVDFSFEKISRLELFPSILKLIWGTLYAFYNMLKCHHQIKRLHKFNRIDYVGSSKNILYLKTNLWFGTKVGGSIGHVAGVINGFLDQGYNIDYFGTEEPLMIKKHINKFIFKPLTTFGFPQELNLYSFQNHIFSELQKNIKLIRKDYLFIYSRMAVSNYSNVLLSKILKIPLILEYNGSEVWVFEKWGSGLIFPGIAKRIENICLKYAHLIVVVSEVLKEELISRGIEARRIVFYPNCIDPEVFNPLRFTKYDNETLRKNHNISKDSKIVSFIGTFGQWHGTEILAKAINHLCDTKLEWLLDNKIQFMLIGDGLKMGEVKNELKNENVKKFVIFTGLVPQDQAPNYLSISDILVSPHVANDDGSKFFGSPTKLFEYMAFGKAIIASDLDQIGELLANSLRIGSLPKDSPNANESQVALLTNPGNYIEVADAIVFLIENPVWRTILGDNVRKLVLKNYTWERHIDEIVESAKQIKLN